jgi:hypothetical protein
MGKGLMGFLFGGISGLVVGILIGALLMTAFCYFQSGGTNIPYDQTINSIANKFTVRDITWSKTLTLKHMLTAPSEIGANAPLDIFPFAYHKTYTQSFWVFCSGNDIDATMCIWGPGDDGKSYMLEFSRVSGNAINIKGYSLDVTWAKGTNEGYAYTMVVV